jgi:hypothetical protein
MSSLSKISLKRNRSGITKKIKNEIIFNRNIYFKRGPCNHGKIKATFLEAQLLSN